MINVLSTLPMVGFIYARSHGCLYHVHERHSAWPLLLSLHVLVNKEIWRIGYMDMDKYVGN